MSCPVSELTRGAVCLALYPYTTGFPVERVVRNETADALIAQLETAKSIEDIAATLHAGAVPELVVSAKLRRVLLLQTGTTAGRQDVTVARINSISDKKRAQKNWYLKLQSGIHVAHQLLSGEAHHGTDGKEAFVDCMSVSTVRKNTILRRAGQLTDDEMRGISEKLMRTMELDLSRYLDELRAREA
jgi:hypothetical protein